MKLHESLCLLSFIAASAHATLLNPGDTNQPIGSTTVAGLGLVGGPIAESSETYSIVGGTSAKPQDLSGTLISAVYKTTGGTLDFFYQIEQNPNKPASPFDNVATQDLFAPITSEYSANAWYLQGGKLSGSPFLTPTMVAGMQAGTRNLTASRNDFAVNFQLNQLGLTVKPSMTTSAVFVIATNAKLYQTDTAQISGGTISAHAETFSATPEPGFYGVLAIGLGILLVAFTRRQNKEAENPAAV
jgi:hypothetical protein